MKKEKLIELGLSEAQIRAVQDEMSREMQKVRSKDGVKRWEEERLALEQEAKSWKEKAEQAESIWQKKLQESRYEM